MVEFPDLPEAFTNGTGREEALFNASEVLPLTHAGRGDEDMEKPRSSTNIKDVYLITPFKRILTIL